MSSFLPHTAQAKYYDKSHRVEKKLDFTLTSFGTPVSIFSVIFSSTTLPSKEKKNYIQFSVCSAVQFGRVQGDH